MNIAIQWSCLWLWPCPWLCLRAFRLFFALLSLRSISNDPCSSKIKVIIIPDIESVNYGRGVGYEIIEHVPPDTVKEISATKIREQMRQDGKL